jgi:hypothetical protein
VNDLQTLFTIIFGIYFATTVGTSGRFWFFDSTAAMGGDWRAVARLVLGFIGLNLLPFAYFMGVLWWLEPRCIGLLDAPLASLGVLFAGLGGFGIYRIFLGLVLMRRRGSRRELLFYSAPADLAKHYQVKAQSLNSRLTMRSHILGTWCLVVDWPG